MGMSQWPPLSYDKLTPENAAAALTLLPGWSIRDGALTKTFRMAAYSQGVLFANAVALMAERLNHHPDMTIRYDTVEVALRTHDAGGGLTGYDFELARRVEAILTTG
jgi:4a-hydroxytetrahydrobiopterin dehydratase